jgi:hypothetical protein
MGISWPAFEKVGGIPWLAAHEDRGLVERLEKTGCPISWSTRASVWTSTRMKGRAPEGFASTLAHFAAERMSM